MTTISRDWMTLRDYECEIKVLPLTGPSMFAYLGIRPQDQAEPMTPGERRELTDTLLHVVRTSNDASARTEALDLLASLGVVPR